MNQSINQSNKPGVYNTYNLLCIAPGNQWKTSFLTKKRLFESILMSFELKNALTSFQRFINDTLAVFLDRYVTAYLDHIPIY